MADSMLRDMAKNFAKQVVLLCREMRERRVEYALVDQFLRSGTSIGANLHEARYAQGTKDFISKLQIAQKECYETEYWLELLYETNSIPKDTYESMRNTCKSLLRMMIASLKTLKEKS